MSGAKSKLPSEGEPDPLSPKALAASPPSALTMWNLQQEEINTGQVRSVSEQIYQEMLAEVASAAGSK